MTNWKIVTPTAEYQSLRRGERDKTLTATIEKACGSWWLYWSNGERYDLDKSSAPPENHGYPLADIIDMVTNPNSTVGRRNV